MSLELIIQEIKLLGCLNGVGPIPSEKQSDNQLELGENNPESEE